MRCNVAMIKLCGVMKHMGEMRRADTGREAEEDERVVVALLRAQGQKESRVGRKLLEG